MVSPSPISDVGGLKKMIGTAGISLPSSFAWAT
jgi:hypothetical protein